MLGQPGLDRRGLVRGVVVADQMHVQFGGHGLVDRDEELLELGGTVFAVQLADHRAVGDVERGEQTGDAVADVVVGAPLGHARHHRQHGLGPVQCLDLTLLVHAQHHRPFGRIVVQANDIHDLLHEHRISGELECLGAMRLEAEIAPDPADGRLAQPGLLRHRRPRPVRGVTRSLLQRRHDHLFDLVHRDRRRPARPVLIHQGVQTPGHETGTPFTRHRPMHPQPGRDLHIGQTLRAREHDPASQGQRLRTRRPTSPPLQRLPLISGQHQLDLRSPNPRHPPRLDLVTGFPTQDSSAVDRLRHRVFGSGASNDLRRPIRHVAVTPTTAAVGRIAPGPEREAAVPFVALQRRWAVYPMGLVTAAGPVGYVSISSCSRARVSASVE